MSFDLAAWQRTATDLIGGGAYEGDDPALRELAESGRLELVREIVRSWRELRIRNSCPLTSALLEERGTFAETVATVTRNGASPYREALAMTFLDYVTTHFDDDAIAVAAFELEMIRVHRG